MRNRGPERTNDNSMGAECFGVDDADNSGAQPFLNHRAGGGELSDFDQAVYLLAAIDKSAGEVLEKLAVTPRVDHPFVCKVTGRNFVFFAKWMTLGQDAR